MIHKQKSLNLMVIFFEASSHEYFKDNNWDRTKLSTSRFWNNNNVNSIEDRSKYNTHYHSSFINTPSILWQKNKHSHESTYNKMMSFWQWLSDLIHWHSSLSIQSTHIVSKEPLISNQWDALRRCSNMITTSMRSASHFTMNSIVDSFTLNLRSMKIRVELQKWKTKLIMLKVKGKLMP